MTMSCGESRGQVPGEGEGGAAVLPGRTACRCLRDGGTHNLTVAAREWMFCALSRHETLGSRLTKSAFCAPSLAVSIDSLITFCDARRPGGHGVADGRAGGMAPASVRTVSGKCLP